MEDPAVHLQPRILIRPQCILDQEVGCDLRYYHTSVLLFSCCQSWYYFIYQHPPKKMQKAKLLPKCAHALIATVIFN